MTKNKTKKHSESFQGKNITLLSGIVIKNDDFFFRKQFLLFPFNCSATCEGLHADVLFETDPLNKMITRGVLGNELEANNGNSKVFKYASKLIKEYRAFKKNMIRGFNFEPTSPHFGALNFSLSVSSKFFYFVAFVNCLLAVPSAPRA